MATLSVQTVTRAGINTTLAAAAAAGDKFLPDSHTYLHVKNTNAATRTVTIVTPRTVAPDITMGDVAVVVPATTGDVKIGPFPADLFADPADGLASITYSSEVGVTVGAFRLSAP